ncbi:FtsX-like permease family protein [Glaciecola petra]|uniref:FtsX-like permease family protein n=1 Tax=Glaciecola petra TaxID=3075602 RepID=A0ABU2ZP45_9ALTE|nr:FtsX-like permease family protein [Aestuariibacter sp. P117]MDT0594170.1 FtsX-like permease family protein [Aestuariibacter sp. P117]
MSISAFIALRYTQAGTKQSFVAFINMFSIIGIALGIAALIIVLSVMNGLEGQLKKRILGIMPHVIVDATPPLVLPNEISTKVITQLLYVEREVIVQSRNNINGLIAQGTDISAAAEHSVIAENVVSGNWDSIKSGSFKVAISRILANQMGVDIGQDLRVISTNASQYSPLGRIPSQRLVTIGAIFNVNSEMDDKVIIMHIEDLARLSRQKLTGFGQTRIVLKDAFDYQSISQHLDEKRIKYQLWRDRQGPLFDAVKMEKNMMSLMLMLVIAVAAFNVVSALVMVVSEKKPDIAILQTQGMLPTDIMRVFLFNGIFNGLKGVLGGVFLGLIGCWSLNYLLEVLGTNLAFGENGQGLPIDIRYQQIIIISLVAIVLCALASWYPAKKAQSITPANSLSNE